MEGGKNGRMDGDKDKLSERVSERLWEEGGENRQGGCRGRGKQGKSWQTEQDATSLPVDRCSLPSIILRLSQPHQSQRVFLRYPQLLPPLFHPSASSQSCSIGLPAEMEVRNSFLTMSYHIHANVFRRSPCEEEEEE